MVLNPGEKHNLDELNDGSLHNVKKLLKIWNTNMKPIKDLISPDSVIKSLLRRLQAQTLPNATPPIGKIYPFTKMALTFEPVMRF